MPQQPVGKVIAIALRGPDTGPMREVQQAQAVEGGGLADDVPSSSHRGLTLISEPQWRQTTGELGADLPWHIRRANVLVDAEKLGHLIGRTLHIGEAAMEVNAETKPCGLMDKQHLGLREALQPDCRGGIYGRITAGGIIRVGDEIRLVEEA